MEKGIITRSRVWLLLVATVVLLGGLLIIADWEVILEVLAASSWSLLGPALVMVAISYLCISYSFGVVSRLMGIPVGLNRLAAIGFVSSVLNHLVQSGGVAGYSVRYALMRSDRVPLNDVLAASILHFYLTSLAMQAILPLGFTYLLAQASLSRTATVAIGAVTVAMVVLFVGESVLIFRGRSRRHVLTWIGRFVKRIAKKDIDQGLHDFDSALTRGISEVRHNARSGLSIAGLVAIDWFASALALGFCFEALGSPLDPPVLFTGFVIGIMAGVLSSLPAGIGVQDGSMAGVFALLGVGFEQAVLAALLFRGVFYVVPYFVSLGFYWRLTPRLQPTNTTSGTM
jgi:uncharacterized protein (TIRG00374 family)